MNLECENCLFLEQECGTSYCAGLKFRRVWADLFAAIAKTLKLEQLVERLAKVLK